MPIAYSADALIYDSDANTWILRPDFDITLHRVNVDITDADGYFDGDEDDNEVGDDVSQSAIVTDMAGNTVNSGQIYDEEFYAISDSVGGVTYVERIEINGTLVGYFVDSPLVLGETYTQTVVDNVTEDNAVPYSSFADVPCFAAGTLIETPEGPKPIETLCVGDLVLTFDHGPQPIVWSRQSAQPLGTVDPDEKPVLIRANALGPRRPHRDLVVSPQHRIFVGGSEQLQHLFGRDSLVPAKALTGLPRIRFMAGKRQVTWVHIACQQHEILLSEGALVESLLLGPMVVKGLSQADRRILRGVFGNSLASEAALNGPPARDCLTVGAARNWLAQPDQRRAARKCNFDVEKLPASPVSAVRQTAPAAETA